MTLEHWAIRHSVTAVAIAELRAMMGINTLPESSRAVAGSEAAVSNQVRLDAARNGIYLWRNNVGACVDKRGRSIRYGLCNDSKQLNERIKSADLIGIKPVLITPDLVGSTIGQFVSRECKEPGWQYSGTDRERAQLAWAELCMSLGADATFTTGNY